MAAFDPKRRATLLVLAVAGAGVYFYLAPSLPKDHTVHFVLGDSAPRVIELDVRYALTPGAAQTDRGGESQPAESTTGTAEDWTREATFRFSEGNAPRIVTHEPRLAEGDYLVEVDVHTPSARASIRRRVPLRGGSTSIDLAEAVPR